MIRVLYIAEIVGKAGISCCKKAFNLAKERFNADFVIACADGATNGNGLGRNHAAYLHKLGIDALTTGECCFYKKDLTANIERIPYVLRPENLVSGAPGSGTKVFRNKIGVAVLLGQSHFNKLHGENPWERFDALAARLKAQTPFVIIEFHAEATAEKQTLFALAAGKVSAVIGSHTRIQTSDERIIGGTAVISCAGRTGSINSVGGCDTASRIKEYLSGIPDWTRPAWDNCELQGVSLELNEDGSAASIERFRIPVQGIVPETNS
ncbi:MAG: TIGR00282 family metallophosphoesterase [Termitinemataceae bacterium]|nr:MAG: TIGR00282 family metallophosphoesterase [Termitinemataceae bacterium]